MAFLMCIDDCISFMKLMFDVLLMSVGVPIAAAKESRLTCLEKQIMDVKYLFSEQV